MKNYIVITSIFRPTAAAVAFSRQPGHELVVVGDRKSPAEWEVDGVVYLSLTTQQSLGYRIGRYVPTDHYCRKMFGYLFAIAQQVGVIIDTDDDNHPLPNWHFPDFAGHFAVMPDQLGFLNIYELYTDQKIWPRGYPLRLVGRGPSINPAEIADQHVHVGVWQGLANNDPNVDAIYRITSNRNCIFRSAGNYVLGAGSVCPFNSQNTAFSRAMFPLLYLPAFVTQRFTDIMRGLVAQPIMWAHGFRLGFTEATVEQLRNPHDIMADFESEIPMHLHAERVVDVVGEGISAHRSIAENLLEAYLSLHRKDIVKAVEVSAVEAWIADLADIATTTH